MITELKNIDAMNLLASLDAASVDAIITDDELPDHWARFIEDRGITLHRVHLERGKNCD